MRKIKTNIVSIQELIAKRQQTRNWIQKVVAEHQLNRIAKETQMETLFIRPQLVTADYTEEEYKNKFYDIPTREEAISHADKILATLESAMKVLKEKTVDDGLENHKGAFVSRMDRLEHDLDRIFEDMNNGIH